VWQQPKTKAGVRKISISPFLASLLADQLAERSQPGPNGLVFVSTRGTAIESASFNKNHWSRALAVAGLEGLRWHDLRHTAVALAVGQGAHPKAIQTRMGHASIKMTLDRYGHLFPELDERIADGVDAMWRARELADVGTDGAVVELPRPARGG